MIDWTTDWLVPKYNSHTPTTSSSFCGHSLEALVRRRINIPSPLLLWSSHGCHRLWSVCLSLWAFISFSPHPFKDGRTGLPPAWTIHAIKSHLMAPTYWQSNDATTFIALITSTAAQPASETISGSCLRPAVPATSTSTSLSPWSITWQSAFLLVKQLLLLFLLLLVVVVSELCSDRHQIVMSFEHEFN